jgi:hypothetical protein
MPSVVIKRKIDRKPGRAGKNQHYSPKQRLEVVTSYLMLGKVSLVAAATGVPEETIHRWKAQDWFKTMVTDVRSQSNVEVSGRLRMVIDKSVNVINDRLEHGDFQYDPKKGTFVRKPVGAKVAADILAKSIDKQMMLDKIESAPTADASKIEDRLKAIQDKLLEVSRFNQSKTIDGSANVVREAAQLEGVSYVKEPVASDAELAPTTDRPAD